MNTGRSLAQANALPESIVRRQELAAAAVSTGPRTTIIIPRMKMSDLKISPGIATFQRGSSRAGGFLSLCYYAAAFRDIAERGFQTYGVLPSQAGGQVLFDLELEREVWSIAVGLCGSSHFARRERLVQWPRRFQLWIAPPAHCR